MTSIPHRLPSTRKSRGPRVATLVVLFSSVVFGEVVPDPPPLSSDLEEQVEVRLIQLTILAVDGEELPVRDLRPDELIVEDEGDRMRVAFLERVHDSSPDRAHARVFVLAPGGPREPVTSGSGNPTSYFLLVDTVRTPARHRKATAESLARFLSASLRPNDQVALISTADDVRLEVPLTSDRDAVASGVRAAFAAATNPRVDPDARLRSLSRRLRSCGADTSCRSFAIDAYSLEARSEVRPWLQAIEGAIRLAGGLDGRKVVVAVGPGVPIDRTPEIRSAIDSAFGIGSGGASPSDDLSASVLSSMRTLDELARERNVTLHFVGPPERGPRRGAASESEPGGSIDSPLEASHRESLREMREMASQTGGALVVSENAADGLDRTLDLERSAYVLGYYLPASAKVRRSRDVRIRSTREGVEILAPKSHRELPRERDSVEGALLLGPSIEVETPAGTARRIPFLVRVEPRELGYRVKGGEATVDFGLEVTVLDPAGRTLVRSYHFVRHAYDKKDWRRGDLEPMELEGWVELVPGTWEIRASVHNARAEREGSWSRRIEIRSAGVSDSAPAPDSP